MNKNSARGVFEKYSSLYSYLLVVGIGVGFTGIFISIMVKALFLAVVFLMGVIYLGYSYKTSDV